MLLVGFGVSSRRTSLVLAAEFRGPLSARALLLVPDSGQMVPRVCVTPLWLTLPAFPHSCPYSCGISDPDFLVLYRPPCSDLPVYFRLRSYYGGLPLFSFGFCTTQSVRCPLLLAAPALASCCVWLCLGLSVLLVLSSFCLFLCFSPGVFIEHQAQK